MGYKVNKRYVGTQQVRPEWKPGANTIAYYPLSDDFNDYSGNNYNLTNNGGSITTFNGVKCAYYSGSRYVNSSNTSVPVGETRTLSVWAYCDGTPTSDSSMLWTGLYNASYKGMVFALGYNNGTGYCFAGDYVASGVDNGVSGVGKWSHIVGVVEGMTMKLYVNGEFKNITKNYAAQTSTGIVVAGTNGGNFNPRPVFKGYVSRTIIENKARTAQDVSNYYNQTKSKYGL